MAMPLATILTAVSIALATLVILEMARLVKVSPIQSEIMLRTIWSIKANGTDRSF